MLLRLLDLIVCPCCSGPLACFPSEMKEDEVLAGELACSGCAAHFRIVRGIPRLLCGSLAQDKKRTAEAFGWEWQRFRELHEKERYREQFLDWIYPIKPEYFVDKVVLDAGCGMGRFSMMSAEFGAREVLAVDISDAVEAAAENTRLYPNVHVVQADIYHLPLPKRLPGNPTAEEPKIDFAYSIGVLHHLPDPAHGFLAISDHIKSDGDFFAWVYGREHNAWIVHLVNPLREAFSSRLPRPALYAFSFALSIALQGLPKLLYWPTSRITALQWLQPFLPYRSYFNWLAGFGLRHNHHVVFDHLVAPTAFYIPRGDFVSWFARAGFDEVEISERNENSWRGFGRRLSPGVRGTTG